MQIFPLSEGSFSVDQSKKFIPLSDSDDPSERSPGSLLVEIQPFLIKTARDLILLDAGLGFEEEGELQLVKNIRAAGFDEKQVTKVLLSHLHKDHAGAIRAANGEGLACPNARYYVQKEELAHAADPNATSYSLEQFDILVNNPQCYLLDGDGAIDDYIRYEISAGHSRYHQVFWIEEEGVIAFFGGDEAPQLGQMRRRYAAKYDMDGKRAMNLRAQWWERGQREQWRFLFYHDRKNAVYGQ